MQRLHAYPDIRAMFRRLLIATVTGVLAALAVAVFRHSMYLLEWLFLSNESGSLVNAAAALSPWRRALTPALGGLAAGVLLWGWQRMTAQRQPGEIPRLVAGGRQRQRHRPGRRHDPACRPRCLLFCTTLYAEIRMETVDRLRCRRRDGQRLSCAAGGQPVYRRDPVWHTYAGLPRPGGDCRCGGSADHAPVKSRREYTL